MAKVGVVLSGCGFKDGAEIQEAVFTLLYLDQYGVDFICLAPDKIQSSVVDHYSGEQINDRRNVLTESARIARGEIKNISEINTNELDALILPGGFGAALNLSDFAKSGKDCQVDEDLAKLILSLNEQKKPIGFICIAPVIGAKVLGHKRVKLTIGNDIGVSSALSEMGAIPNNCEVDDILIDKENLIVSTPAYMLGKSPKEVAKGIEKLVAEICQMVKRD